MMNINLLAVVTPPSIYHRGGSQSVKGAYIDQLGWPIYQVNGSTKERGNIRKFYIFRGEL